MSALLVLAALLGQADPLADRLKRDGWRAVEALGTQPSAKADLERLADGSDEEVAWWAGAALADMDARLKAGESYIRKGAVTLEARERPAREVLSELLAREKLVLSGDLSAGEAPVTVSFKDAPFFQSVDEVCRQARCVLRRLPSGAVELQPDPHPGERPLAWFGPQSFALGTITHRSAQTFTGEPVQSLEVELSVRGDPRAWIRAEAGEFTIVSALDDAGGLLGAGESEGNSWSGDFQPATVTFKVSFPKPPRAAKKLARLRGIATLRIARNPVELVFANVLKEGGQTQKAGPITITLKSVSYADREYGVYLEFSPEDALGNPELDDVRLEDSKGRPFSYRGGGADKKSLFCRYQSVDPTQTPARLRVTALPDCSVRRVYFELKDIPIR